MEINKEVFNIQARYDMNLMWTVALRMLERR